MFIINLTFLIGFVALILVSIYKIRKLHSTELKKLELLFMSLGGISALLVTYNIYINMQSNDYIEKNHFAYNTLTNIDRNFLNPQKELVQLYPEGFFLYASMNPDTDLQQFAPETFDPIKRKELELYYSIRIFQTIEDFLTTASYDATGLYVWINTFLMWLQSPTLQYYWKIVAFNYADDTRELVNMILPKANALAELRKQKGTLTAQDYDTMSKSIEVHYR